MISVVIPVYRDTENAKSLVESLLHQRIPADSALEIIVVDDGSGDGTAEELRRLGNERVNIIALPKNSGRSVARNAGAQMANGDLLVFIDCDCRPIGNRFLEDHVESLRGDCIASYGPVEGNGDDFWARYQKDASVRRSHQHAKGIAYAGSTQNFSVRRAAFLEAGSFDPRYREYGFEDRDLFVRLAKMGGSAWCNSARVRHLDNLDLMNVLVKMQLAAGTSALFFSHDHPDAYRALGYASIDVRLHGWLRPICFLAQPALRSGRAVNTLLKRSWMPYAIAKSVVKLLSALAYMKGSMELNQSPRLRASGTKA